MPVQQVLRKWVGTDNEHAICTIPEVLLEGVQEHREYEASTLSECSSA